MVAVESSPGRIIRIAIFWGGNPLSSYQARVNEQKVSSLYTRLIPHMPWIPSLMDSNSKVDDFQHTMNMWMASAIIPLPDLP